MRKALAHLPYLPRALVLVWRAASGWALIWALLLLVQGLLPVATVYLTRTLVDRLVAALNSRGDWASLRPALVSMALMAGVLLAGEILRAAADWVRAMQSELVQDHITAQIHQKSATVDLAFFDMSEYYDRLELARAEAQRRPVALLEGLGSLVQHGITLLAMTVVIAQFSPWLPVALLLSTLPAFTVVSKFAFRQHEWSVLRKKDQRLARYYDWLVSGRDPAPELRLFELGDHFKSAYRAVRQRVLGEQLRLTKHQSLAQLGAGAAGLLISGGAMAWMVWRAVRGLATAGDLALLYQTFNQGLRLMRALLENIGHLYVDILFLGDLFEFLELKPQVVSPPHPAPALLSLREGIRFRQVTFRYAPGARPALKDFDLFLPAGRMAAIVGMNGAGKSTLIKLLCRFYDPEAGSIEIDGVDLRRMKLEDLRRLLTVLFQQPMHYHATVRENIAYGNLRARPGEGEIQEAAREAGVAGIVARLPRAYDTELGRAFGEGTELSVGEWQRLALARACVRRSPVIVLDEPTSSMDPWAELEWLRRFQQVSAGRTVILITHRFSTAILADHIHVMAEGGIVESGSHGELLARGGRYAEAWLAQQRADEASQPPVNGLPTPGTLSRQR
jgi:ATP-binding cassette subfamily B protein